MPAYTLAGVLAKVRLAHEMLDHTDESWDIYEDESALCWTRRVQSDLERMAGRGAS